MLIGIQLYKDPTKFIQRLMDNRLLTIRAAENVIRVLPPLNVKKYEIDKSGYRLIFNTNDDGGQTVYHIHLHLIGGEKLKAF